MDKIERPGESFQSTAGVLTVIRIMAGVENHCFICATRRRSEHLFLQNDDQLLRLPTMDDRVAVMAQRDKILLRVVARVASELLVVNFEM